MDVKNIISAEPVFVKKDKSNRNHEDEEYKEDSELIECTLNWDEEHEVFINKDADRDWVLDDHRHPEDSYYVVEDSRFSNIDEAIEEALKETKYERSEVSIVIE